MDPFVLDAFFQDFEVLDVSKSSIPLLFRCLFEDSERHESSEHGHHRVVGKAKAETADFLRYFSFWQISEIRNESRLRYFNFSRFSEIRNGNKKKGRNVALPSFTGWRCFKRPFPFLKGERLSFAFPEKRSEPLGHGREIEGLGLFLVER